MTLKKGKLSLDGIPRFTVSLCSVTFSIVFALLFKYQWLCCYVVMLWYVMQSLLCTLSANEMSPCVCMFVSEYIQQSLHLLDFCCMSL